MPEGFLQGGSERGHGHHQCHFRFWHEGLERREQRVDFGLFLGEFPQIDLVFFRMQQLEQKDRQHGFAGAGSTFHHDVLHTGVEQLVHDGEQALALIEGQGFVRGVFEDIGVIKVVQGAGHNPLGNQPVPDFPEYLFIQGTALVIVVVSQPQVAIEQGVLAIGGHVLDQQGFHIQGGGFVEVLAGDQVNRSQQLLFVMLEVGAHAGERVGGFADVGAPALFVTEYVNQGPVARGKSIIAQVVQGIPAEGVALNLHHRRMAHSSVYFFAVPLALLTGYFFSFRAILSRTICSTSSS